MYLKCYLNVFNELLKTPATCLNQKKEQFHNLLCYIFSIKITQKSFVFFHTVAAAVIISQKYHIRSCVTFHKSGVVFTISG